ncbi:MAG: dihydrodipicolinate reductase, partial [Acidobacteriota bacterium]|nr:dihydrodipicolinate reductase [Acidobacteriota bacterium]
MPSSPTKNPALKLALLGNGKMGKTVASLAPQRGFEVRLVLDEISNQNYGAITPENFKDVDVCIDFTTPEAAFENIRRCAALGRNLVVGTTGWHNRLAEVRQVVERSGIGLVYGANFSIGV